MSDNLLLTQVASNNNSIEVPINDKGGELDAAITVQTDFAITNTNARTLTSTEFRRSNIFHITDGSPVPTAAITLTLPAVSRGIFAVVNLTSFDVTVTISGQSVTAPIALTGSANALILTCDGTNVRVAQAAAAAATTKLVFNSTGHVVASSSTVSFDLTGFLDRGYSRRLTITETGGVSTGTYDVRIYSRDTKLAADILYSVDAIDSTADTRIFTDRLMIGLEDEDTSEELHIQFDNNDGAQSMTFTINLVCEKLAP